MLASVVITSINHVLRSEQRACARLQSHAGKTIGIWIPPVIGFSVGIDGEGKLRLVDNAQSADATLALPLLFLPRLIAREPDAFEAATVSGDQAHVEAGWAPKDTQGDGFEAAIRAVCKPIFDKPLEEIAFGRVLLQLFQASRQFNVEIQPQLVLLQKNLLNMEGLGRGLDLDLWKIAKPSLKNLMPEQIGLRGFASRIQKEAPNWAIILPEFPRLIHQAFAENRNHELERRMADLVAEEKRQNHLLTLIEILFASYSPGKFLNS